MQTSKGKEHRTKVTYRNKIRNEWEGNKWENEVQRNNGEEKDNREKKKIEKQKSKWKRKRKMDLLIQTIIINKNMINIKKPYLLPP